MRQTNFKKYINRAYKYFESCKICPDKEDLLNFVASAIEDDTGITYDLAYDIAEKEMGD